MKKAGELKRLCYHEYWLLVISEKIILRRLISHQLRLKNGSRKYRNKTSFSTHKTVIGYKLAR